MTTIKRSFQLSPTKAAAALALLSDLTKSQSSTSPPQQLQEPTIDLGDDPYGARASWAEEYGFISTP